MDAPARGATLGLASGASLPSAYFFSSWICADADDRIGEPGPGRGAVVVGDSGEVVDGGVAVGEVARLQHRLGEGHVASDSFGVAFGDVERDEVLDGDAKARRLAAAGAVPPGAQAAHPQG